FFAAMQVVVFHFAQIRVENAPLPIRNLVASGYTGVSLFFVLSGFILAYNYLDKDLSWRGGARFFLIARFARIYPVYALGLLVSIPFFLKDHAIAGTVGLSHY